MIGNLATDVWDSARAAWIRIGKRPSTWILGFVMLALMATLNYGIPLLLLIVLAHESTSATTTHAEIVRGQDALRKAVAPAEFIRASLTGLTGFAYLAAIPVIFGVLTFGGEYAQGTWKTLLTQRASRPATYIGTTLIVVGVLFVFSIALLAVGAAVSTPFGAVFGHLTPWPSAKRIIEAFLAGWLTMVMWAAFGVFLAMLFRQTALAIGIGIVYTLAVEGLVVQILGTVPSLLNVRRGFPGQNVTAMIHHLTPGQSAIVSASQGALVTGAFMLAFFAIGAFLLRLRDVT